MMLGIFCYDNENGNIIQFYEIKDNDEKVTNFKFCTVECTCWERDGS